MARTRSIHVRMPEELEQEARDARPELADIEVSTLVRIAIAVLAGHPLSDAIRVADEARQPPGRKPAAQGVAA
jgi:hypothetical protein